MAYGVTCHSFLFFIDIIKPINVLTFATLRQRSARSQKLLNFLVTSSTKLLELYYDVTVKFSPILKETFGQIIAKQQIIELQLASLS